MLTTSLLEAPVRLVRTFPSLLLLLSIIYSSGEWGGISLLPNSLFCSLQLFWSNVRSLQSAPFTTPVGAPSIPLRDGDGISSESRHGTGLLSASRQPEVLGERQVGEKRQNEEEGRAEQTEHSNWAASCEKESEMWRASIFMRQVIQAGCESRGRWDEERMGGEKERM